MVKSGLVAASLISSSAFLGCARTHSRSSLLSGTYAMVRTPPPHQTMGTLQSCVNTKCSIQPSKLLVFMTTIRVSSVAFDRDVNALLSSLQSVSLSFRRRLFFGLCTGGVKQNFVQYEPGSFPTQDPMV